MNWALGQRHLKPGPWIVLIQLSDRHNKDTKQVNPEQSLIAHDCNMSRATVNRHLDTLEALGLIRRVMRQDPVTKRQLSTFYILALDFDDPPEIEHAVSQNETQEKPGQNENTAQSRVSELDTEPCLKFDESRVSKTAKAVSQNETLTMEIEPVREPCVPAAAQETDFDFEDFRDRFIEAYPRRAAPDAVAAALRQAIEDGADPDTLIAAARAYAVEQAGNSKRYIAMPQNWLGQRRWLGYQPDHDDSASGNRASREDLLKLWAGQVASGKKYLCAHIPATAAREMIARDLVTARQCAEVGVISRAELSEAGA